MQQNSDNALQTFQRRLEILRFLKERTGFHSTDIIQQHLIDVGLLPIPSGKLPSASIQRKLQRDLQLLWSAGYEDEGEIFNEFGLQRRRGERNSFLWCIEEHPEDDFSAAVMPEHLAVSLALAEKHLVDLMPSKYHQLLQKHYQNARRKLLAASTHYQPRQLQRLLNSVIIEQRGLRLAAINVDESVLDTVYQALILNRRIKIQYKQKWVELHPHGVVFAKPKMYLLALKDSEQESKIRSYLLHRITAIELLQNSAQRIKGFDLEQFVHEGGLEVCIGEDQHYTLRLLITASAQSNLIQDLQDTPIAADQCLTAQGENSWELTATVRRTYQLRNWLLALGAAATVIEPLEIRQDIKNHLQELLSNYRGSAISAQT